MTPTLALLICATTLFTLTFLLILLLHDTTMNPPRHRHVRHAIVGVAFVHYNDQIRALQQEAMGLLDHEPLRGYHRLWRITFGWNLPSTLDGLPKDPYPLGPQDTIAGVPAPGAPFV